MLEKVQCIVVSNQGSLGLVRVENGFSMLRTLVELDETSTEAAHRALRIILGNAADFDRLVQLNVLKEDEESMETTFVLRVDESATRIIRVRGFQWLSPAYRTAIEGFYPKAMGDGVASSYRRTMALPLNKNVLKK